jgi:ATP-dependent Clp protease protease subunit
MFKFTNLLFSYLALVFIMLSINTKTNANAITIEPIKIYSDPIIIDTSGMKSTKTNTIKIDLVNTNTNTNTNTNKIKSITLEPNNFVAIIGSINKNNVNMWIRNISSIENQKIYVYINSNGGSVEAGQKLIDQFTYLQLKGVTIECIAQNAYSMAFQILQSCDKRYITPSATVMQHQMSVSELGGQFDNLLNYLTMIKQMANDLDLKAAKRIGISYADYKLKTSTDWWLYGEDIVQNNVADEIVYVGCGKKLYETFNYKETVEFDISQDGDIEFKKTETKNDLCPL